VKKINYQLIIEYNGTRFVGWQTQKNGKSVQAVVETALSKTLKKKVKIIGSGRTDAGVNAWGQSVNFYHNDIIRDYFKFISTVNFFLKSYDISVINIKKRNLKFHARHSAKKRLYEYLILNRQAKPSLEKNRVWQVKKKLDLSTMKRAMTYFMGTHNFSVFRASSCTAKSPIRTITKAKIKKNKDKFIIEFESKSFLQKQVRSMVGCIKYIGEKKWSPNKIKKIIKSQNRGECAPPAPAQGLYLKKVFY
tara:strand:- start:67 stop:813 length:747 start_codon:yes stop_codon:yes gene_type:complete